MAPKDPYAPAKAAEEKLKANAKANTQPAPASVRNIESKPAGKVKSSLKEIPVGVSYDYKKFTDGSIVLNSGSSTGGVQTAPYVSAAADAGNQPKAWVIISTPDGRGYQTKGLDAAVQEYLGRIPRDPESISYYKKKLQAYYPTAKGFQRSMSAGPVTDKDTDFQGAIKNALSQISVDNFNTGAVNANSETPTALYDFDSWVNARVDMPSRTTDSSRSSGLTTREDAIAEFRRTVQQYVGDPKLVDRVDALAEAYWDKLHAAELKRTSYSTSTRDPITGNTVSGGVSYAQLTEQDRIEMRLGLINKGDKTAKSAGITKTTQQQLQDAGGLIGDTYTQLNEHAADMGIQLTHADLLKKTNEVLKPGGGTAGVSSEALNTGITQAKNSITQAAKIHFKNLAPYIDNGLKVSDISSNFQRIKEKELELGDNTVDIYDTDVQNAIRDDKGIMSPNDFTLNVRKNPNWRFTAAANEGASSFINTILKTWGKI